MSKLNHVSKGIGKALGTLKKMTKKEADKRGYCKIACGLYCRRAGRCNGDLFAGTNERGAPITEKSEYCRLSEDDIKRMQGDYNYNPMTKEIKKR